MEVARWRTFQADEIEKVVVVVEEMEVSKGREYAKLTVVSGVSGICYTAICRDREYYGRIVEGEKYWLDGVIEVAASGLILVAKKAHGVDEYLLTAKGSKYYNNLDPIEIG